MRHLRARLLLAVLFTVPALPATAQNTFFGNFDFTWRDLTELVALLALVWGVGWLILKPRIAVDFVTKADYAKQMEDINAKLSDLEEGGKERGKNVDARLSKVELQLESLPNKDSFHKLAIDFEGQAGDIKEIRAIIKPLASAVTRIEDHLRRGQG
jgi:Protein of unknown function (DUF2730).